MSAQAIGKPNSAPDYTIPVVGGHSGVTILPLLSQAQPALPKSLFDDEAKLKELVKRIQFGGDEVVQAKAGAGSATLSMAYAGYKFAAQLISAAFEGKTGVVAPSYVYVKGNADVTKAIGQDLSFFSVPVELGVRPLPSILEPLHTRAPPHKSAALNLALVRPQPNGVEKVHPLGDLTAFEKELLEACLGELPGSITKGESFIQGSKL